jgi:hypothetical protein
LKKLAIVQLGKPIVLIHGRIIQGRWIKEYTILS